MKTQYSIKHFIRKFEAIPEEKWCRFTLGGLTETHCALGHLGVTRYDLLSEEVLALIKILPPANPNHDN